MNIFNKQEITTGDRIVAYIDGKCFIRDGSECVWWFWIVTIIKSTISR